MSLKPLDDRSDYWDNYYDASKLDRLIPSQFAVFVAGELRGDYRVIDLGCGSGRDALYFAQIGHRVVGVDASEAAIRSCEASADARRVDASFIKSAITAPELAGMIAPSELPTVVYARFFVHALTDAEEAGFLDLVEAVTRSGDLLATETRTVRDSSGAKVTSEHYRRYIMPAAFQANVMARGFGVDYATEGFGHAKYGADDAYVAREIFSRR